MEFSDCRGVLLQKCRCLVGSTDGGQYQPPTLRSNEGTSQIGYWIGISVASLPRVGRSRRIWFECVTLPRCTSMGKRRGTAGGRSRMAFRSQ